MQAQEKKAALNAAEFMCAAARTAPKAKGIDNIVTDVITGQKIKKLASAMRYYAKKEDKASFARDADGLEKSACVVLLGTKIKPAGLTFCGFCGWPNCAAMQKKGGVCAYNNMDLGIAIGSAVAVAADFRIDNRIMYSAGIAAIKTGLLPKSVKVAMGIPLSVTGKNIFFDRK